MDMKLIEDKRIENRKLIGDTIHKYRCKVNMSQEELAEHINVSATTIGRYEKATLEIPASCLKIISDACRFNPLEYFGDFEKPKDIFDKIAINFGYKKPKTSKGKMDTDFTCTPKCQRALKYVEELAKYLPKKDERAFEIIDYLIDGILIECKPVKEAESAMNYDKMIAYWTYLKKNIRL